jgi:alanyl-tRNA synthetase
MIVTGVCNTIPPHVADYIETCGKIIDRNHKTVENIQIIGIDPISLEDDEWVGVTHFGDVEIFKINKEYEWRAETSRKTVFYYSKDKTASPEKALESLKAAAALVKINLPDVLFKLETIKKPDETLAEAYERLKHQK